MDFWTSFPYWGILLLVAVNALLVARMKVEVEEEVGSSAAEGSERE